MGSPINKLTTKVSSVPVSSLLPHETSLTHGNKFAIMMLNDTRAARDPKLNSNSPKFSIYVGNGKEINTDPKDPNKVINFDFQDDEQQSIAAQFHVTSLTDISTINLVPRPGQVLRNRSAIKGKADVIQLNANEMVIINSGASSRNSHDMKSFVPAGVHIYAGDREGAGAKEAQPMVLGNNLQKALDEMYTTMQSLSTSVTDINTEIMNLKFDLITHFHPTVVGPTAPSPDLGVKFVTSMASKDVKRLIDSFIEMINHWIERINRTLPISKVYVLSAFNTVN